jgi:hypothetical protein
MFMVSLERKHSIQNFSHDSAAAAAGFHFKLAEACPPFVQYISSS